MKTLMSVLAALVFCVAVMAQSQDTQQSGSQSTQTQPSGSQSTQTQPSEQSSQSGKSSMQNQKMSGQVSSDAKTITTDKDNRSHNVDNPSALKGYENQHVAVLVRVDPDTGAIHIVQVVAPGSQQQPSSQQQPPPPQR